MKCYKLFSFFVMLIAVIFLSCFEVCYAEENNFSGNFYKIHEDYIYRMSDSGVQLIKLNNSNKMKVESFIDEGKLLNGNIYVLNNKLFLSGVRNLGEKNFLNVFVYDIYDKNFPIKTNEFSFCGSKYSFKEKNGIVYLCLQGEENKITIISLDLNKEKVFPKIYEFGGSGFNFTYLSEDDLYVVCSKYSLDKKITTIYKFDVDFDTLTYVDEFSFDGFILNERFINEYEDELRILSFSGNDENTFYVLNEDFKILNSVKSSCCEGNVNNIYFDGYKCYLCGFVKRGYFSVYDLSNHSFNEISKMKLSSSINYIYKLNQNKILAVGSEHRADTYKNIQSNKIYDIIKNIGIKVMLIDVFDKDIKLHDEYLIKGKQVYSPCFMDEGKLLYLKDKNILAFPLDISNYTNEVDINSAMEVSFNFYRNSILNRDKIFSGVYVFDLNLNKGIDLKFVIDNDQDLKNLNYKEVDSIQFYKNNIFIFTDYLIKIFNFKGKIVSELKL